MNVQNRVSKASNKIPQEVIEAGISTQKQQNSFLMFVALTSKDSLYDETFIQNYIKITLIPRMQRIRGVAEVQPLGSREYSRSEEHTSELQTLMHNSYADFCLKKNKH